MKKQLIIPKEDKALYDSWRFAPAVKVGETVYVSGQVGTDEKGKAGEGIEAQTRLAFQNLTRVLREAGAGLEDVVEITTFHIDLRGEISGFAKVKNEFLPKDFPAWTAVGVTQLALPDLRVEIRATAVVGSGK